MYNSSIKALQPSLCGFRKIMFGVRLLTRTFIKYQKIIFYVYKIVSKGLLFFKNKYECFRFFL